LLLNAWYLPIRIIGWEDAVTAWYKGIVDIVAEYEETISSPSVTMKLPAVVRLKRALPNKKKGVKFSRAGVYTRDRFRCAYCGKACRWDELTYDHVWPRRLGGPTNWLNIKAACIACNQKKGSRTPDESGMYPSEEPYEPKSLPLTPPPIDERKIEPEWLPFLQKNK
jgi:5-methylcytosine-specific restriction endonuclease McrA